MLVYYNIDFLFIEFEVMESFIIQYEEYVKKVMDELKKIGVMFVLDDFGIGFFLLLYLKDFEFNMFKIDKMFI